MPSFRKESPILQAKPGLYSQFTNDFDYKAEESFTQTLKSA